MYLWQKKLKDAETVSFDIFDTLIERKNIKDPRDVFRLTGEKSLPDIDQNTFCTDRIIAEKKARDKKDSREVTLTEIYQELPQRYEAFRERLQEEEKQIELEIAQPKHKLVQLYRWCQQSGKKVYIVSDMYLPVNHIIQMLEKCGIQNADGIYLSNEYLASKRDGRLFRSLITEQNIAVEKHVHIGDDIKGDYFGARKNGMQAILIHRKNRIRRIIRSITYKIRIKRMLTNIISV